jgi:alpha-ketoglutarate-dependent taurine dioxygenase
MSVTTRTRFDVVPLSTYIGAEIRGLDLRDKPDDETIRAIYQTWLDHLVIVFPEQKLSQEDFIRATGFFGDIGELSRPPAAPRRSANALIRCSAPTRTPARRRCTSTG